MLLHKNMKYFIAVALSLILGLPLLSAEEKKLADYVDGLLNSHDLAIGLHKEDGRPLHITTYLSRLKLKDEDKSIPPELEYDLWRHFLDCHHLCQVFYHQTYWISRDLPIVKIMNDAFPGFKASADGEGGVWINKAFDFLQTVDPHKEARQAALKAEQGGAEKPATAPELKPDSNSKPRPESEKHSQ